MLGLDYLESFIGQTDISFIGQMEIVLGWTDINWLG